MFAPGPTERLRPDSDSNWEWQYLFLVAILADCKPIINVVPFFAAIINAADFVFEVLHTAYLVLNEHDALCMD